MTSCTLSLKVTYKQPRRADLSHRPHKTTSRRLVLTYLDGDRRTGKRNNGECGKLFFGSCEEIKDQRAIGGRISEYEDEPAGSVESSCARAGSMAGVSTVSVGLII